MKKQVFDYFVDLHQSDLKTLDGAFIRSVNKVKIEDFIKQDVVKCSHNNVDYYLKRFNIFSLNSLIFSRVYNEVGILTPPVYVTLPDKKDEKDFSYLNNLWTMQQSVDSLPLPQIHRGSYLASHIKQHIFREVKCGRWSILSDPKTKEIYLKYLTPEGVDELLNMFIADELKTEIDRHYNNYYVCSLGQEERYGKVIPIDMDGSRITFFVNNDFEQALKTKYTAVTPAYTLDDHYSIEERVKILKNLIASGNMPQRQCNVIKTMLNHDLSRTIKDVINIPAVKRLDSPEKERNYTSFYDRYCQLWDYHRTQFGSELSL